MPDSFPIYAAKRLAFGVIVFILMLVLIFFLMRILPGDPISNMYPQDTPAEDIERIKTELGLNKPLFEQFVDYLSGIPQGDFGKSFKTGQPVLIVIGDRYTVTIELMLFAWFLSVLLGIPLGMISALKRGTLIDHTIKTLQLGLWAIPGFWLAIMLQLTLGVQLGLFPIFGRLPPAYSLARITGFNMIDSLLGLNPQGLFFSVSHLFLPSLSIALFASARLCRVSKAEMVNTLSEDYITTARAKGVKESAVVYKHAFRNALLPTITIMAMNVTSLMGGSVLTEKIFALNGMGTLLITAVFNRDFFVIQAVVILYVVIVVVVSTLTDLVYRFLDPRIEL